MTVLSMLMVISSKGMIDKIIRYVSILLIYLADHINYSRRQDIESEDIESIWIEIKLRNSKSFLICSVYRPPSSKADWSNTYDMVIFVRGGGPYVPTHQFSSSFAWLIPSMYQL